MSSQELHDLLVQLENERKQFDIVDQEQRQRLDEIIESLEQQKLYPDNFDHYSALSSQIQELVLDYESQHPSLTNVLSSIAEVLRNFKV
jgi:uncharacterized protein involved in exopolysaccharide biosynthesis